jgi:hypothetical protein
MHAQRASHDSYGSAVVLGADAGRASALCRSAGCSPGLRSARVYPLEAVEGLRWSGVWSRQWLPGQRGLYIWQYSTSGWQAQERLASMHSLSSMRIYGDSPYDASQACVLLVTALGP